MKRLPVLLAVLALALGWNRMTGQVALPFEFRHVQNDEVWLNFQSRLGVPISTATNVPLGSNGRQPTTSASTGLPANPSPNQFRSFLSFGAALGLPLAQWQQASNSAVLKAGSTAFNAAVAGQMGRPMGLSNGLPVMVLRRAVVGATYLSRAVSFAFGQVIPPPETDENGKPLVGVPPSAYWLVEPFSTNGHTNSGYYFSEHAALVYAIQPGPVSVTWMRSTPVAAAEALTNTYVNANGTVSFQTNGPNVYLLSTRRYVVSGGSVKPPRRMYWTEKSFQGMGVPVRVPAGRVGAVNIVYNNNFPRSVSNEFTGIGVTSPTEGSTNAAWTELRTLWYDQRLENIYAYNMEGRVFVELLGDRRADGRTYEQLGFEVVDVLKQPIPAPVRVELGDRVVPPPGGDVDALYPSPLRSSASLPFAYLHSVAGAPRDKLFATRETRNNNDYIVHWLEEGVAGLLWPALTGRYDLAWPTDASRYSHYVRPLVATDKEAAETAVDIDRANAASIEYQDPLDFPRAQFTEDFRFYTWLDAQRPVHRTLLRYNSGNNVGFERVFSWLDANLRSTNFSGGVVSDAAQNIITNLAAWNASAGRFDWPQANTLSAPRVVTAAVDVGARIQPPPEAGRSGGSGYLAGYINQAMGTSYSTSAYLNPFASGFDLANKGAIIPVNAIPGTNGLEVWWFRAGSLASGLNAGNKDLGFQPVYWPSVIGRYTLQWPTSPREIVLASNAGGALEGTAASGRIYFQNDPSQPGYNPNEEHALILGGTAYATRDDLNVTNSSGSPAFSSQPFVLVEHRNADGRPDMAVFRVLREKASEGLVFDYVVPAGRRIQPPAPLTFLGSPVEGAGAMATNYNSEPTSGSGDLPVGWAEVWRATGLGHYASFTYRDRKNDFWVYRGPHRGLEALRAGRYDLAAQRFVDATNATAVLGVPFEFVLHASRQPEYLAMDVTGAPSWLSVRGLSLVGQPSAAVHVGTNVLTLVVRDVYDGARWTNALVLKVATNGAVLGQPALVIASTNPHTGSVTLLAGRPPFLSGNPSPTNSFTMRYYYKTEAGFAWPGLANPPAVGSIVPYLRPWDATNSSYVGEAGSKLTASLGIVYRPHWPVRDPKDASKPLATLPYGATLAAPGYGLPGVRDFKTARILYEQSVGANITSSLASVVLHDPTRSKSVPIHQWFEDGRIPAGIKTETVQGKVYFPGLPPHLGQRLFIDPNMSAKGSLVLQGEYKRESLGESYLHLNVLRGSDLRAVFGLCPASDVEGYGSWTNLVASLSARVEYFREDLPRRPGTYVPYSNHDASVGDLVEVSSDDQAVDSYALSATGPGSGYVTLLEAGGAAFTSPGDPVQMHVFRVGGPLVAGEVKVLPASNPLSELLTLQHTPDLAGRFEEYEYEWKIAAPVEGLPPEPDATMSRYVSLTTVTTNVPRHTLGGAGIRALSDNYVVMRYRPANPAHPLYREKPTDADWSAWTKPALAEGWIKRVLAGVNPFNQRVNDLFNNRVNTDVSLITQAGARWEGDVALNLETINNYGLIEIYETVLRRGRMLSIEAGYNYGPANDALLLAAGYLSDLYMMVGNEAWADAGNPTIGIGTADKNYGDIATALFSFKGQVPTLLEEELALLRGRDDFLLPGVETRPVYNRLVWNYTRGIDAGEVIYALNYNIQEKPDEQPDGVINAADAARMFPQGHGDAYGHYLTALKGYYSLLLNQKFDWVPRIEAVNVLGQAVSVDYQDERKFATAAAAVARAGRQVFDLTWRKDYVAVGKEGWQHFGASRRNPRRSYVGVTDGTTNNPVRYWGMDPWASRVTQGAYLNWVVGNAILPHEDPDPSHEGIQKVDRTTVPELGELPAIADDLQTAMGNAETGISPLGMPEDGMVFDINPSLVVGVQGGTHFEQVFDRAAAAIRNAVGAFDGAKDVTRLMRSEQDSLADFQSAVARQEISYNNDLIEIYGTPYPDDVGAGRLYKQGYAGPDLVHYKYVDLPDLSVPDLFGYSKRTRWTVSIRDLPGDWASTVSPELNLGNAGQITFEVGPHGFAEKPATWSGSRMSPGRVQEAISGLIASHARLRQAMQEADEGFQMADRAIDLLQARRAAMVEQRNYAIEVKALDTFLLLLRSIREGRRDDLEKQKEQVLMATESAVESCPLSTIVGTASGGDMTSAARSGFRESAAMIIAGLNSAFRWYGRATTLAAIAKTEEKARVEMLSLKVSTDLELRGLVNDVGNQMAAAQSRLWTVEAALRDYHDKQCAVRALEAKGDRLQAEREVFRKRSAAVVQGYRTRDAAFRLFRSEKLERYKSLFDLAARYALLAANAYDYETGLLGTSAGRTFKSKIIASRALGVVQAGSPQFAGSNTGDPGISSALAEMKADWDVLKTRLGFNRPDVYSTTVSLRMEKERILPGADGATRWRDFLNGSRMANILEDADVRRYCMQADPGDGLPVPGLVITFSTTIGNGLNLFGLPLAAGDHAYSPSSFATKMVGVGIALPGYLGMADPPSRSGGQSPSDPPAWFLSKDGLAATPYVYLIPVGADSMRSPPLGDRSEIRTWSVSDLAIPMPFNIGASDFDKKNLYLSSQSLAEPLFNIRKHAAFRPVADKSKLEVTFNGNEVSRSEFINNRLVGRSVWNSQWKLVIPGRTLLNDAEEGLDRFLRTVSDIEVNFTTYSYSGN